MLTNEIKKEISFFKNKRCNSRQLFKSITWIIKLKASNLKNYEIQSLPNQILNDQN
jgi:hypothetical protein